MLRSYRLAGDRELAVHALGLACCSVEIAAAVTQGILVSEEASDPEATLRVLLIAGTVTVPMRDAVDRAWRALPEPKAAVAFGACACAGGPYWDAPSVAAGVDPDLPVRAYVVGCPPRPAALEQALRTLRGEVTS